jgi:hypothetical protein
MGRVINPDTAGKRRNQLMRSSAEILRLLSQKQGLDEESKDMLAQLVFAMREIDEGVDASAEAWEKRDYWQKAEEFRQKWYWAGVQGDQLKALLFDEKWENLPTLIAKLLPRFAEVKITKMTVKPELWHGNHTLLLTERAPKE